MGDNGFAFGEHGLIDKRTAYEESMRVPMLARCPDLFGGGRVVKEVVANIDIMPTFLAAAGVESPAGIPGRPLETNNLIFSPKHQAVIKEMNDKLFDMLEGTGGMNIPLYRNRGGQNNLRNPDGAKPAAFPPELVRKPGPANR